MPRVQRICGIRVPVFDESKPGPGAVRIQFVLEGHIISKKNNEAAIPDATAAKIHLHTQNKANGGITLKDAMDALAKMKVRFVGHPGYRACKKRFVPVIQEQMEHWRPKLLENGMDFPLPEAVLSAKFAFKDRHRIDTINKMQTIHDLLVEAGAIRDDDYTVLNPIKGFSKLFNKRLTENICLISLTMKNEKIKNEIEQKEKEN
jgi:hypothetical protein